MGRIVIRDDVACRTVPAPQFDGEIEIELGDDPVVTVPDEVVVQRK